MHDTSNTRDNAMHTTDEEFPLLSALGLYAANIKGDGNCLFNALSDQLYGNQDSHTTIRARVIQYMRENADYFKQFIDVHPGGGIRRNPKRKNAGTYSTPTNSEPPSDADVDRVFDNHLHSMSRGGTYGDNMEITAFSSAFEVDVKIYQRDFAYMVTGMGGHDRTRPVAHIAYHMWEHYSSIRNLEGPHTGVPEVHPRSLTSDEEAQQQEKLKQTPLIAPWQIDVVSKSLPWLADKPTIKRALEAARGNTNAAVSALLDEQERGSGSSAQESSSIEREDSADETHVKPSKKQDRKMSRTTRSMETKHALAGLDAHDGSQESVGSWEDSETSSMPESSQQSSTFAPPSIDSSDSRTSTRKPTIKLKFSGARPDGMTLRQRAGKTSQRQVGPARITARDRKDMKKQAQKAARKERAQQDHRKNGLLNDAVATGMALREKGNTETPPVDYLRTLYI